MKIAVKKRKDWVRNILVLEKYIWFENQLIQMVS
jgi:hypothetical protein